MQPSLWSGKLEEVGKGVFAPIPVYPRLWEYIDKDLKYIGYDKTIKAAMARWGNLTSEQLAFALDTSQLPRLSVSSVADDFAYQWYVLGDTILIDEKFVKLFEENARDVTVDTPSGRVEYLGVLILLGLVVWGNQQRKPAKGFDHYRAKFEGFCKDVYGMDYKSLALSQNTRKAIPLIRK